MIPSPIRSLPPCGFMGDKTMVKCESGQEWMDLPYRADIEGVIHTKGEWDSSNGMGLCSYIPVPELVEAV